MARAPRKRQRTRATFGPYGRTVRLFEQDGAWKVHCPALGVYRTFRGDDAEGEAWGFAQRLGEGVTETPAPAIGDLWAAYTGSSDYRELRKRSRDLYAEAWGYFTEVVPLATPCDEVTVAVLERVRATLESTARPRAPQGLATNTIRKALQVVKGVFAWGERTEYLSRNRVHAFRYKVSKDRQPVSPDEYTEDEWRRLLGALSFDKVTQRHAYVVLCLCGYQGVRLRAALHLRWDDLDFDATVERDGETVATGAILWRAAYDKQGRDWEQPMRAPTRAVLLRLWHLRGQPSTGWCFPARNANARSPVYTAQSFWWALQRAEERGGVRHRPRRAAHGLRRKVAGDLAAVAKSDGEAMRAIGDKDARMADRYVKRRRDRLADTLHRLDEKGDE